MIVLKSGPIIQLTWVTTGLCQNKYLQDAIYVGDFTDWSTHQFRVCNGLEQPTIAHVAKQTDYIHWLSTQAGVAASARKIQNGFTAK